MPPKLHLRAGVRYVRRDGKTTGPLRHDPRGAGTSAEFSSGAFHWCANGNYWSSARTSRYDLLRPYRTPKPRAVKRSSQRPWRKSDQVIRFLLGEASLDGVWYGDNPPGFPRQWWRTTLRAWLTANGIGEIRIAAPPTKPAARRGR